MTLAKEGMGLMEAKTMTKYVASIAGITLLVVMAACADGAMTLAAHSDAEETVSLDEAVVEAEMDASGTPLPGFEDRQIGFDDAANDIVDLDWASDSG